MKALSLAIAIVAGAAAIAPAVQAQTTAAAPAESAHGLRIGDQLNARYTRTLQFRIKGEDYGLPNAPINFHWYLVDDTAYLVQEETNRIMRFQKVTPKAA